MTPVEDISPLDDHSRPMRNAIMYGLIALALSAIVSGILWWFLRGVPGLYGVLIGAALGGGFVLITAILSFITSNSNPTTTAAVVLGGWLLKLVVAAGVIVAIRDLTFYDPKALFFTVVFVLVGVLGAEVAAVIKTPTTYVTPAKK